MDYSHKLKRLLSHWKEHNNEHAEIYRDWAERVLSDGNERLSKILTSLYHETKQLNRLFEDAIQELDRLDRIEGKMP